MGLSTFTELKTAIKSWSNRGNVSSQDLDEYIEMAEHEMFNNASQTLSITEESVKTTLVMDNSTPSRFLSLPDRFLRLRGLNLVDDDSRYELTFQTPEQIRIESTEGQPVFYTITNQLEFSCEPDKAYNIELDYFRQFTPLSTSNQTNSVLDQCPNMYLFGALWVLKLKEEEDQQATKYLQLFLSEINGFNRQQSEQRLSSSPSIVFDGMIA